ncbi:hypothetical protein EP331_09675 [bacterium]|nr:MAG: hypothetical protein EP331_09675 [bacterium]
MASLKKILHVNLLVNETSHSEVYNDLVDRFYPKDRVIKIGSFSVDKTNYSKDINVVFRGYKSAASKEIEKSKQNNSELVNS